MPGIPLVVRETIYSRGADQMCREDSRVHLTAEEEIVAEESLSIYCKPVELYNILRRRAIDRPSFLQRCLHYKQQAKNKRRIQMTISLSGNANDGLQTQSLFPMYILLARPLSNISEHSAVYHFSRVCLLTSYIGVEEVNRSQVKFVLPEMNKLLAAVKSDNFCILLVSCAVCENDLTKNHTDMIYFPSNIGGYGFLGKISLELLYMSWEKSPNLSLGERAEMLTTVDMHPCVVKLPQKMPLQVLFNISAEEVGAKERTPYNSYSYSDVPASSLSNIVRYYNNKLQRTEVTEDFSCPFCLVKCASYKGLRHHLPSSHDLFNFEFWVNEEYQAVNVSVNTDQWRSEIVADGVDPKQQTFCFCSKPLRRRIPKSLVQNAKHVHPLVLDSDLQTTINGYWENIDGAAECLERNTSSPNATGCSSATAHSDPECVQSVPGSNLAPPGLLQFAKKRKLSAERYDPQNRTLLQKRRFFHSHRAQPMVLEQIVSDQDSEDEVDDDVADFEDRKGCLMILWMLPKMRSR